MTNQATPPKRAQTEYEPETRTSFAYRHYKMPLKKFRKQFTDAQWLELKELNPNSRTLIPKQIKYIYSILGLPDDIE